MIFKVGDRVFFSGANTGEIIKIDSSHFHILRDDGTTGAGIDGSWVVPRDCILKLIEEKVLSWRDKLK